MNNIKCKCKMRQNSVKEVVVFLNPKHIFHHILLNKKEIIFLIIYKDYDLLLSDF